MAEQILDPFHPDNPHRKQRVTELSSDCQNFLRELKDAFAQTRTLSAELNAAIAKITEKANLKAPPRTLVQIFRDQKIMEQLNTEDTVIDVSEVLLDVGVSTVSFLFLAPAATAWLAEFGIIAEEVMEVVLLSALGMELTLGAVLGGLIAAIVAVVVVIVIDEIIEFFEGGRIMQELRRAIHEGRMLRESIYYAMMKSEALVKVLAAAVDSCKALLDSGIELTAEIMNSMIAKDVGPAIEQLEKITMGDACGHMMQLDHGRRSWIRDG